jgi:hypothetical protein
LEIVFTSQIACCRAWSAVAENTPVYAQTDVTFENQNNVANTRIENTDNRADATSVARKLPRRTNIQKYTANFTTGDTGIATALLEWQNILSIFLVLIQRGK